MRKEILDLIQLFRQFPEVYKNVYQRCPLRKIYKEFHYSGVRFCENDFTYYTRLLSFKKSQEYVYTVPDHARLQIIHGIMNDLYTARRITMDQKAVVEALDKLDSITNACSNDHNGEYSEIEMFIQENKAFKKFIL